MKDRTYLRSLGISSTFFLVLGGFLGSIPPLYGQNFETLLQDLTGSEADQLESEIEEKDKETDHPVPSSPSSTEMPSAHDEEGFAPEKNIVTNGVTLQGLDKQTARVFILDAAVGQPIEFGSLKIIVRRCEKAPLEDRQESMAFITISDLKADKTPETLFSGWIFASSPALSALDHPTYDVWLKDCKNLKNIKNQK